MSSWKKRTINIYCEDTKNKSAMETDSADHTKMCLGHGTKVTKNHSTPAMQGGSF